MDLDHIFICVSKGAHEARELIDFGLIEGSSNVHPGQGTANRRFFFHNVFLELLYLDDATAAKSDVTANTGLYERCSFLNDASAFGFCFKPSDQAQHKPSFKSWQYKPVFFPEPNCVEVACAPYHEPMWFFISFLGPANPAKQKEPIHHEVSLQYLTHTRLFQPLKEAPSDAWEKVSQLPYFCVFNDAETLLELEFDHHRSGKYHDFRPTLPLLIKW
jgi:hypothetical protein